MGGLMERLSLKVVLLGEGGWMLAHSPLSLYALATLVSIVVVAAAAAVGARAVGRGGAGRGALNTFPCMACRACGQDLDCGALLQEPVQRAAAIDDPGLPSHEASDAR